MAKITTDGKKIVQPDADIDIKDTASAHQEQSFKKVQDIEPGVIIATAAVGVWVIIVLILLILGY